MTSIENHIINYYKNLFNNNFVLKDVVLMNESIPTFINDEINMIFTLMPIDFEIKEAVMTLNKDDASGPDGFGAFFYQTYGDIIGQDVKKVFDQFFKED